MKKTTILTVLILLMTVFMVHSQTAVQPTGSGTSSDPYQIATLDNLYWLTQSDTAWDKYYIQTVDINAADTRNWDISGSDTLGYLPIGTEETNFTGIYNGKGHIIDSLFINRPDSNYVGLIGYSNGTTIDSLGITNVEIIGNQYLGAIVGYNRYSSNINNCYSTGEIIGNNYVGGLVGVNELSSDIYNSFSTANVTATDDVGGLIGVDWNSTHIENCYSIGLVKGNDPVGGLIGRQGNGAITSNSFWNIETSGQTTSDGGTGLTTFQMQHLCVYLDSTWDFIDETANGTDDIWGLNINENGGYPFLSWQDYTYSASTCVCNVPAGSGTISDPYQIATLCNLRWLSETDTVWDKNFIQTADIDASETRNWNISGSDTLGFSPIGNATVKFKGTYNGQGHIIDGLFINRFSSNYIGLFGETYMCYLFDIGVVNANIIGQKHTACLVGWLNGTLEHSFSTGVLYGNSYLGGLAGTSYGTIKNSYSHTDVSGPTTASSLGGLVGSNGGSGSISNSYSTGSVTNGYSGIGGLVGYQQSGANTSNSFWNIETSEQTTSADGTGLTTFQMQHLCVYLDSTWDFIDETANGTDDIWGLNINENGGYPFLSWQDYTYSASSCVCNVPAGSGTTSDPYQIATLCNLRWLSETDTVWNKNFIQTADIDASETRNWNISGSDTLGFLPIGGAPTFIGSYNGQGHIIKDLFINRPTNQFVALFGYTNNVNIDSLGLINVDITADQRAGSIVGFINGTGVVSNCYSTGNVKGNSFIGGLVGSVNTVDGFILNSYSNCNVSSTTGTVGGFIGSHYGNMQNCYSVGIVVGSGSYIGGLVGYLNSTGASVNNSFWDTETSGQTTSAGGTGLTTLEMQQMCVYADSTWDFMLETVNGTEDIWGLNASENGGYPFLSWQGYTHTESCCGYVDLEKPTITCVANQTVTADATHNYTVVGTEFDPTDNNDNCGVASVINDFNNSSTLDGETLPEGTTTIVWTVTDDSGNINICSFDVQVNNYVGINSISKNETKIYPNPAHDYIIIENSKFKIQNIEVFDITGKVVKEFKTQNSKFKIQVEGLKQGVYFIKLTTNNTTEVLQFIKK